MHVYPLLEEPVSQFEGTHRVSRNNGHNGCIVIQSGIQPSRLCRFHEEMGIFTEFFQAFRFPLHNSRAASAAAALAGVMPTL
uniref:Uncharacterized protein n=1 Tax=Candidatus Kentrum sp. UNK TaxID=2126344 RepID=A0A451AQQ6_9GAMM|nr:MAG: hypothetical protein BECKUNK1418G_GA0071005_101026 [Candidatus Kentron sp. UNK]VFK68391.1 MAG: hypothetical protein BECKUNK1418H_GA0071006_100210 [Candidatus Kentron sp. UNK]